MNTLVLLGNGFDLAHGLKTRYSDFILWYLNKTYRYYGEGKTYNGYLKFARGPMNVSEFTSIQDFFDKTRVYVHAQDLLDGLKSISTLVFTNLMFCLTSRGSLVRTQ